MGSSRDRRGAIITSDRLRRLRCIRSGTSYVAGKGQRAKVHRERRSACRFARGLSPPAHVHRRDGNRESTQSEPYAVPRQGDAVRGPVKINTVVTQTSIQITSGAVPGTSTASFLGPRGQQSDFHSTSGGRRSRRRTVNFLTGLIFVRTSETTLNVVPPWHTGNNAASGACRTWPRTPQSSYADPTAGHTPQDNGGDLYFDTQTVKPKQRSPEALIPSRLWTPRPPPPVSVPALEALPGARTEVRIKLLRDI